MDQWVSLITLGVADMDASAAFYEGLGWAQVESPDGVIAFDLIGQTLGLYPRAALADDLGIPVADVGGFSGVIFGHNVPQKEDVAPLLERAKQAGGTVLKPAVDVFWGGHHGFFADPDGHVWEIAHNPFSPLGPKGEFQWNGVK
ncbi:VOC family protein [Falsihalocynthiibacter arcticus]|uniref:Glyoxalase n=1 Tax=Falsihalocynthiibacter arcticus TaxID=1579316 RepID=A0A126UV78_9RHOB|nr:VOC family protein [Falsihalocynthiibacter arcticus]AML49958.1 glyoxalase [Falsihalocynthiibacter arcticus]